MQNTSGRLGMERWNSCPGEFWKVAILTIYRYFYGKHMLKKPFSDVAKNFTLKFTLQQKCFQNSYSGENPWIDLTKVLLDNIKYLFVKSVGIKVKEFLVFFDYMPLRVVDRRRKRIQESISVGVRLYVTHRMKSVQIRSFFWSVFSCIWTEYRPEETPFLNTFHAVTVKGCIDVSLRRSFYKFCGDIKPWKSCFRKFKTKLKLFLLLCCCGFQPYNAWCHKMVQCTKNKRKLLIWSHLLKKSLMENFNFCAVVRRI